MSPKSPKRYACTYPGCKSSFPRPSKLANHTSLHEGKKPFQCDIDGCDKGYTTKTHLKRHQSIQHQKEQTNTKTICLDPECKKEFSNVANMQRHMKRAHNPNHVYNYICKECNQSFPKKKLLHQHSYLHTGEFYYNCDRCHQGFHLLSELHKHTRLHKVYKCTECKESFTKWSELRHHKLSHRPLFKCSQCHYKTYRRLYIKVHESTHTAIEKRKKFHCKYENCSRSYLYMRNLNLHVKVFHLGIKREKIKCLVDGCPKSLSKMVLLKRHMQVFHEGAPTLIKRQRRVRKDAGKPKANDINRIILGVARQQNVLNEVAQVLVKS